MIPKQKRYCTAYACIPSILESYAIRASDIGDKEYVKICTEFYKELGFKSKIIKVEVYEILPKLRANKKKE